MTNTQNISGSSPHRSAPKETTVFGVPIGRLGLPSRLLISGACAFMAFLAAFFLGIIGVAIYDSVHGLSIQNLNDAYLYIASPVGILAFITSLTFLVGGWFRNKISANE